MQPEIHLTRLHWQSMRRAVRRHAPLEACGLLAGRLSPDGNRARVELVIGVPNAERSPVRFRMQPRAQVRAFGRIQAAGLELVGIFHSHPAGPDHPSPTDVAEAAFPVAQLIWYPSAGQWQVRAFHIADTGYAEIELRLVDAA